uniref:ZIP family transporter n=1 Tax=Physcomitrium patens TaxID=3218 RepID=A0A7I4BLK1_PHYPA
MKETEAPMSFLHSCEGPGLEGECLDKAAATRLKTVAIIVIFLTSFLGFYIPVSSRRFRFLNLRGNPFWMMKVFAGGVILATAFIHMLPTAQNDFASPCLPQNPRGEIPTEKVDDMTGKKGALGETHVDDVNDSMFLHARHLVTAQVFELGVAAHSITVGISVGVSNSPCTIKPVFAALTFHQFFEGVALGGCVAKSCTVPFSIVTKSHFQPLFFIYTTAFMGFGFAITTSLGIAIGLGITASYNENSATSLIFTGMFDAISAGILAYMALVDFIAADFLSKRMQSSKQLQVYGFVFLFFGVGAMSSIGLWA